MRVLCDGGSRGNPGPAAVAAVLVAPGGELLDQRAVKIGRATAADAEYRAILLGLELARRAGAEEIEVRSDSRLAIAAIEREAGDRAAAVRAAARGVQRCALALAASPRQRGSPTRSCAGCSGRRADSAPPAADRHCSSRTST